MSSTPEQMKNPPVELQKPPIENFLATVLVGNAAERGPLVTAGGPSPTLRKTFRNESVFGCGFPYTKTRSHQKITVKASEKRQKTTIYNSLKKY